MTFPPEIIDGQIYHYYGMKTRKSGIDIQRGYDLRMPG
jgi:hypothetical protein